MEGVGRSCPCTRHGQGGFLQPQAPRRRAEGQGRPHLRERSSGPTPCLTLGAGVGRGGGGTCGAKGSRGARRGERLCLQVLLGSGQESELLDWLRFHRTWTTPRSKPVTTPRQRRDAPPPRPPGRAPRGLAPRPGPGRWPPPGAAGPAPRDTQLVGRPRCPPSLCTRWRDPPGLAAVRPRAATRPLCATSLPRPGLLDGSRRASESIRGPGGQQRPRHPTNECL